MSLFYWLMLGLSLSVNVLFFVSILLREKRARDDKDVLVRHFDERLAALSLAERRGLDRFKAVLDDAKQARDENCALAMDLDTKQQDQAAEYHRGKAAAFFELLKRHRGW